MSKLLGIDYGERNVGLAVSNEDQTMAFPRDILMNNKELLPRIKKLCHDEGIAAIVIGESHNYQGGENPIMSQIKIFRQLISQETGLPTYFEPEFMTSAEAERIQGGRGGLLDASAAALILKSFLARRR
jgi:putative Holliday junction resolvase